MVPAGDVVAPQHGDGAGGEGLDAVGEPGQGQQGEVLQQRELREQADERRRWLPHRLGDRLADEDGGVRSAGTGGPVGLGVRVGGRVDGLKVGLLGHRRGSLLIGSLSEENVRTSPALSTW